MGNELRVCARYTQFPLPTVNLRAIPTVIDIVELLDSTMDPGSTMASLMQPMPFKTTPALPYSITEGKKPRQNKI